MYPKCYNLGVQGRNIPILSISQALALSPIPAITLVSGIVGVQLAPSPALATLASSLVVVGLAVATIPVAMVMKRIGRRRGFIGAAALAGLATLLIAYAINEGNFGLFCLAAFLVGTNSASVAQYRFAAAESVKPTETGKAVSYVMIGGIFAGYLGPEVVKRTSQWPVAAPYAGSFIILAGFYVAVIVLMLFFQEVRPTIETASGAERPLRQIAHQPTFLMAMSASAIGYGVMTLIMTATPVNMHIIHGISIADTAWVIQSHIIAMFLPSLFSGALIKRLGVQRLMLIGLACLFACIGIGFYSQAVMHYWWALVLLGVGWNFLFVGGTTLLTQSYWPSERFKAQAANDFSVFGIQAIASLSAGTLLAVSNWQVLNLIALPFLIALTIWLFVLWNRLSPTPQPQTMLETSTTD
jgi:MFS family permease